jgi:hypothetical protein
MDTSTGLKREMTKRLKKTKNNRKKNKIIKFIYNITVSIKVRFIKYF